MFPYLVAGATGIVSGLYIFKPMLDQMRSTPEAMPDDLRNSGKTQSEDVLRPAQPVADDATPSDASVMANVSKDLNMPNTKSGQT